MRKIAALLGALTLSSTPLDSQAQQKRKENPKPAAVESRNLDALGDAPRAQTVGRDVSGVFVNDTAANSGYSPNFVVRGFPSPVPLFDGAAHGFSYQVVDLSTIDHIEFYKGPSAMLFGKALGGYGGAANYIRKSPTQDTFAQVVATVGSFDVFRTTIDVNTALNEQKNLLFRITGSAQTLGSFVNFVRSRSYDIAPMVAFTADNGDRLTLRAEHNAGRFVYRDGVPADPIFFSIPRSFYAGAPVNENEAPTFSELSLAYEHAFNPEWTLSALADYYTAKNRFGWFLGWGYDGAGSLTLGDPVRTGFSDHSFDAQLRLNGKFDTGPLRHNVFLGLEHWDFSTGYSSQVARTPLAPINIFFPVYPIGVNYADAFWSNGAAHAWSRSVYGQDVIEVNDRWRILLGGRYDLLAQRERVFDPFGSLAGEPTASLSKGVDGYFSPRVGVFFRPFDQTQLFAAYGKSLIPNISVRIRSGEAPPPQRDTQYEIGLRRDFLDGKASFEVGLFDITRDNVAISDPSNPSGFYYVVTGQQHSHGIEANVGGEILPNLKINAAATFLHALVTKDANVPSQKGSDLLGAPRRVYNVTANYAFDSGDLKGLELGVSYYYASRAQVTLPNTYGLTLPPQQMLGASLAYNFDDKTKLEINANNLTNSANWTSNGAMFYGEPRTISASLTYKY